MNHTPVLCGWVQDVSARLYFRNENFLSMSGVQHGDPLGLQLIAFVPQQLLHEIKDRFGQTTGAYLDDVTLAGPVC